ncbi:hypothetical protein HK097_009776 [Rhizophlyctis rosea]|uniref:Uncharacterized protein n=1 Tax=Rhizophlyctis rosea TaxID=64517 RepID=A0AAD5SHP8_9FUNG|nr:hypothetical protein HK097_009776 [Rhizophlyctis rosea]
MMPTSIDDRTLQRIGAYPLHRSYAHEVSQVEEVFMAGPEEYFIQMDMDEDSDMIAFMPVVHHSHPAHPHTLKQHATQPFLPSAATQQVDGVDFSFPGGVDADNRLMLGLGSDRYKSRLTTRNGRSQNETQLSVTQQLQRTMKLATYKAITKHQLLNSPRHNHLQTGDVASLRSPIPRFIDPSHVNEAAAAEAIRERERSHSASVCSISICHEEQREVAEDDEDVDTTTLVWSAANSREGGGGSGSRNDSDDDREQEQSKNVAGEGSGKEEVISIKEETPPPATLCERTPTPPKEHHLESFAHQTMSRAPSKDGTTTEAENDASDAKLSGQGKGKADTSQRQRAARGAAPNQGSRLSTDTHSRITLRISLPAPTVAPPGEIRDYFLEAINQILCHPRSDAIATITRYIAMVTKQLNDLGHDDEAIARYMARYQVDDEEVVNEEVEPSKGKKRGRKSKKKAKGSHEKVMVDDFEVAGRRSKKSGQGKKAGMEERPIAKMKSNRSTSKPQKSKSKRLQPSEDEDFDPTPSKPASQSTRRKPPPKSSKQTRKPHTPAIKQSRQKKQLRIPDSESDDDRDADIEYDDGLIATAEVLASMRRGGSSQKVQLTRQAPVTVAVGKGQKKGGNRRKRT